jgi:hypothetical protein
LGANNGGLNPRPPRLGKFEQACLGIFHRQRVSEPGAKRVAGLSFQ